MTTTPAVRLSNTLARLFDRLEHAWENRRTVAILANFLIVIFLVELALIGLKNMGGLPAFLQPFVKSSNYFYAVNLAFTMLLVFEVIELVFSMAHSVAESVGKQFQILSLILLRASFKEFSYLDYPINWDHINDTLYHILSDAAGALLLFFLLGFYGRMMRHQPITSDAGSQVRFVVAKKVLALGLLAVYGAVGVQALHQWVTTATTPPFFQTFYTILIFADFLLVFISLRYTASYFVLFRNSGFALSTVVIRIALTAPPYYSAGLGLCAMLLALGITGSYNRFARNEPLAESV
jgi:hypothetical protein|nr:hypothetical protein [Candidatus Krumholzibacteria bacterium]